MLKYSIIKKLLFLFLIPFVVSIYSQGSTRYVSPGGSNTSPYSTWATAANSIQTAVDIAVTGDVILVGDGLYNLSSNISVTKGVTIRSQNGKEFATVSGNDVTRCFYINNAAAVVDGFTISKGYNPSGFGGAVNIANGGTVQNCTISYSQARDGGGVAIDNNGLLQNCILTGNRADNNSGSGYGGGVRMLSGGITRNCFIYGNTSVVYGGGINIWDAGTIENCTIVNNTAPNGAGVRCRNASVMRNSISYFNTGSNWETSGSSYSFSNNCTTPALPSGSGNITSDPLFVDHTIANCRLASSSSCINTGINQSWMTSAFDIDGHNRILTGTVDMGAYEYKVPVPTLSTIPVLSWPIGNPTVYTLQPTLFWYITSAGSGLTYEVQCVKASEPWPADNIFTSVNGLSYTFTSNLIPGTQYAWRVRAIKDAENKSEWSVYGLFTSFGINGAPIAPVASWPTGNATIYTLQPTLTWYLASISTGLSYEVQCVKASDPWPADNIYFSVSGWSFNFTSNLIPGTQYAWRVRSKLDDTHKSAWSEYALFTTLNVNIAPVVPVASWPGSNATVYTLQPVLNWYLPSQGTGLSFEVQCVKAADPWPADNVYFTAAGWSYSITSSLDPGTQYAWRVRSKLDDTHKSAWSVYALFTTYSINSAPLTPSLYWPVGNAMVYSLKPTLSWYLTDPGAGLTYEFQCVKASDPWPADNIFTTSTSLTYTFSTDLTVGTQYAWRVRSKLDDTHKSAWSAYALFTTVGQSGAAITPTLWWPVGNATIYTLQPTLVWYINGISTGLTYEFQCVKASDPWPADNIYTTSTNITYTFTSNLLAGTQYAWRVRSKLDDTHKSAWSAYSLFTTVAGNWPIAPVAASPSGGVIIGSNSATLSWYLPTAADAGSFEVVYSKNPEMTSPNIVSNVTDLKLLINSLSPGAYYWKVNSTSKDGLTSPYSGTGTFTIDGNPLSIGNNETTPEIFNLRQNYPNPFNPTTVIDFTIPVAAQVSLKIFDVLGREIKTLLNTFKQAGTYSLQWDGKDNNGNTIQSGTYFYRLVSDGNKSAVKKLIFLK